MAKSWLIAVVDDEPSVRKALRRLLSASGHEVKTFASGQEFLEGFAAWRPDCLVLDLHMPGLSGLEVQKELARIGDSLPIVIITAFDDPESRAQCLAAGATAYLLKPFDDQALLDAIANAIESSSTLDGD
jgi:FixJ family two-component response regulator